MILFDADGLLRVLPTNAVAIVDSVDLVIRDPRGPIVVRNGVRNGSELTREGLEALERHGYLSSLFESDVADWYLDEEGPAEDTDAAVTAVASAAASLGRPVLDCCCGFGRLSISLLSQGAEVYGVDVSERSVAAATANVEAQGLLEGFRPIVADMASFGIQQFFGGAISAANSLRYLGSLGRVSRHIRLMGRSLVEGAVFALEVDTNATPGGATWSLPQGEMTWEVLSVDTLAGESLERVTIRDASGNTILSELQHQVSISSDRLLEIASAAGFTFREAWDKNLKSLSRTDLPVYEGNIWYVFDRR
ncbi:class I SAM-dependent methyltransferase [Nonomuraea sp. PA05]|uniref:class I SAM-dependent methyltransferase n=1 Tax=Nonomuraea sp. PA05 TaxID=2604466 RepID=UPI001652A131|nr:class I SAM-dependent methyltransferase [Nonomuraea sp. PA05]